MSPNDPHPGLEDSLSAERLNRYLRWSGGDRNRAIQLYTLNTRISEAYYTPLHMLEITLRNRIHFVQSAAFHDRWYEDDGRLLGNRQPDQLAKAVSAIERKRKQPTPGRVVAELTFGFWTAMFGRVYEELWRKSLHKIAVRSDGKSLPRKDLSRPLMQIQTLRNRIAHYEPILHWDLPRHHRRIVTITEWLSPPAAAWCQEHCRFAETYPIKGIELINDDA